jgi:hypothetical protein
MLRSWHKNTHPAQKAHWNTLWHSRLVSTDETVNNCCKQLTICEGLTVEKIFHSVLYGRNFCISVYTKLIPK